ncbi:uncharacterized protein [Dysidea avara]|uniref:uncharacterized protein n=1 Tax=Dysidea avara TaxID=196820 RepID=UPI003331C2FD
MGEFSHTFCGCFDDATVCLLTYFIPCYMVGKTAEAVGESCCLHCLFQLIPYLNWYCLAVLREKVRENKGIGGSFGEDCALAGYALCAITQMYREVVNVPLLRSMARE